MKGEILLIQAIALGTAVMIRCGIMSLVNIDPYPIGFGAEAVRKRPIPIFHLTDDQYGADQATDQRHGKHHVCDRNP